MLVKDPLHPSILFLHCMLKTDYSLQQCYSSSSHAYFVNALVLVLWMIGKILFNFWRIAITLFCNRAIKAKILMHFSN